MARSPATSTNFRSRSSLTLENLESLPKNNRSVDSFVREQRRNAQFYADEALSFIDQHSSITGKQRENSSKLARIESPLMLPASPLLKSRLEMQQEFLADVDATPPLPMKSQPKELFKGFKHARNDLMDGKKVAGESKRPRSPSDDDEEGRSARLKERRYRKRARKEIMKPRAVTPEQSINGDSDTETQHKQTKKSNRKKLEEEPETELTIRKKKGRGKATAGISLMETFTATNVKKSRLTLQPQNSSKLFKQARSGEAVKLGSKKKENERSASKNSKPSSLVRKSKPNPLETYSKHTSNASKQAKASYKSSKNRRKSVQSATDSFVSDDSNAYQAVEREQSRKRYKRSPPPLETENDLEADGCATYSESWGIGSQLPSDTSSVHMCSTPRKSTEVGRVVVTSSRASTVSSEPKITTLTTPWNFEDPQGAFGRFETLDRRATRDTQGKGGSIPATGQDYTAPGRSRFFFSPLVPIPEHVQNAVPNPRRTEYVHSTAQPADAQDSIHQPDPAYTEVIADEQQTENNMEVVREPSPVDSLECLLHEHDAEDALYGHLFVRYERRRFIQELPRVQTVQEYDMESETVMIDHPDDEAYQYECNEAFNSYHSAEDSNGNLSGNRGVVIDDSAWEEYDQGYLYEPESREPEEPLYYGSNDLEDDVCQPGTYSDLDAADFVEDAGAGNEGEIWQDLNKVEVWEAEEELESFEAQINAGANVLPFAEGRILLLGLGNDAQLTRPLGHTVTRPQRSSTYGQSVQEIEVMAAKQLGHHW